MRVARQLQVVAGRFGLGRAARLVGQQDAGNVCRRAGDGRLRVAFLGRVETGRVEVGDAGQGQARALVFEDRVLVHQHAQAQAAKFRHPRRGARIVFMVARDEKHAMARAQLAQRRRVRAQLRHRAVDHVARDGDDIGLQGVGARDDGVHVGALDGGAHVDVAQLHNGQALQGRRQAGNRHRDIAHARDLAGVDETKDGGQQRQDQHGHGGRLRVRAGGGDQHQQFAQHGQHEQRGKKAHAQ